MRLCNSCICLAAALAACFGLAPAHAQDCSGPTWSTAFTSGRLGGTPHIFRSMDDGALIAGGRFDSAGGLPANNIARWDGDAWHPFGDGLPWRVRTVEVFDSGHGPLLYACGSLFGGDNGNDDSGARVARWDGDSWTPIADAPDGGVRASAIFDDGSGPALFCLGSFTEIAGIPAAGAAKFDGQTWTALASGLTGYANAAAIFDDGSGPALYVGGKFTAAGGTPTRGLARWDGHTWSDVGGGVIIGSDYGGEVNALAVHAEPGDVPHLYAGGKFSSAGDGSPSPNIAAWSAAGWTALSGIPYPVYECAVLSQDGAETLWAAASQALQQGYSQTYAYTLNNAAWTRVDNLGIPEQVYALGAHPFHGQPAMLVGTAYDGAIRARSNDAWLALGDGFISAITAMVEFDRGNGPEVLVSGGFNQVAGQKIGPGTAVWNGQEWTPIASRESQAAGKLVVFDNGSGPAVYGTFATFRVYRLSGDEWVQVGQTSLACGRDLAVFDDGSGPALYSCGIDDADAGIDGVTRLQGDTWVAVGEGLSDNGVDSLAVYNDGTGPALYAAGPFHHSGNKNVSGCAKWNGSTWTDIKGLSPNYVGRYLLATFDDGNHIALYAGGHFDKAGGEPVENIASWNGKQWSPLGDGVNGQVFSMAAFDDGSGPALYVSGRFTSAGGIPVSGLAKWNGSTWQTVGTGFDPQAFAQVMLPSTLSGGSLFLGGSFDSVDGVSSGNFAQLISCHPCFADFDTDGTLTLFDFLAFVNAFNAQDPASDCDHSQSLDLFDFLCFTNSFNTGC